MRLQDDPEVAQRTGLGVIAGDSGEPVDVRVAVRADTELVAGVALRVFDEERADDVVVDVPRLVVLVLVVRLDDIGVVRGVPQELVVVDVAHVLECFEQQLGRRHVGRMTDCRHADDVQQRCHVDAVGQGAVRLAVAERPKGRSPAHAVLLGRHGVLEDVVRHLDLAELDESRELFEVADLGGAGSAEHDGLLRIGCSRM